MAEPDDSLTVQVGAWARLSPLASEIRRAVFIDEQGIAESEEWDDTDPQAVHFVALLDGEAVGCARLTREGKVGRMAVLKPYRGQGVGKRLIQACIEFAHSRQFSHLRLSAQTHAQSFYEQLGFIPVGEPHVEVGIDHQAMELKLGNAPAAVALRAFLEQIEAQVDALPATWVNGSVSELKRQASGHVYLTLVQHDETGAVLAKVRAMVWAGQARALEARFREATGQGLSNNQDIMVQLKAQAHPVHGLSATIKDIYPEFTVGRVQVRLEQLRARLRAEGLHDANRRLPVPVDFFRVAVLSPDAAAGLGDFRSRADALAALGLLRFVYFTATFQGAQAAASLCGALQAIESAHARHPFDAVVIIRGGGSQWDLACLNEWPIAQAVARLPIPVLCGIGHEQDNTIIDELACKRLPTPSMVIDFIEQVVMARVQRVVDNMRDIRRLALQQCQQAALQLENHKTQLASRALTVVQTRFTALQALRHSIESQTRAQQARAAAGLQTLLQAQVVPQARQLLSRAEDQVERLRHSELPQSSKRQLEQAGLRLQVHHDYVASQDPVRVLARGYAMVLDPAGLPVTDATQANAQTRLVLRMRDGQVNVKPVKGRDQKGEA